MGKFVKGHKKIPGSGNVKGSKQKRTMFREAFEEAMGKPVTERIQEIINMGGLDPKEELDTLVKILPYMHPRLQSMEVSGEIKTESSDAIKDMAEKIRKANGIK